MRDHDVSLIVQEHGLFDLLVELELTDQLLARVPHLHAAIATRGEDQALVVQDVHSLQGFLMLVHFICLDTVELLFRLFPVQELEVTRLEAKDQRVVSQQAD